MLRLLPIFATTFLFVVCFTNVQAGVDPYLDKYLETKRRSKHGYEDVQKLFGDRGLDMNSVVKLIGDDEEFAKLLLEKISAVRDMGSLQESENGDQFYVFDSEIPGKPETRVLATCVTDLIRYIIDTSIGVDYATRMYASRGKLDESAFYTYLFKDPGNIWLCQSVNKNETSQNPPFNGRYCYTSIYSMIVGVGNCIPDTCTEDDINTISFLRMDSMPTSTPPGTNGWSIRICRYHVMDLIGVEPFFFTDCTEPSPWNTAEIGFTCALAFFAFMVLCGSFYEIFLEDLILAKMCGSVDTANDGVHKSSPKEGENDYGSVRDNTYGGDEKSDVATTSVDDDAVKPGDIANELTEEKAGAEGNGGFESDIGQELPSYQYAVKVEIDHSDSSAKKPKKSKKLGWGLLNAVMLSFSAVNNCKKLLSAKKAKNTMAALNGLRVLSMFWVILGHSCVNYIGRLSNPLEALRLTDSLGFTAISNATFSVDTFFVLSGFLVAFLTLRQIDSVPKRSPAQWAGFWSLFYFHRWWRLTPVYMAAMGIWALLFPHFGQGWMTDIAYYFIKSFCRRQWWTHPLYINNLYPWPNILEESCMSWSWYLANDMQFYIISPLILIVLYKNGKAGLVLVTSIMFVSLSALFGLNWHYGYTISSQESYTDNVPDPESADITYSKPYTRIPTYLVGMVLGYTMFKLKGKRIKMPPVMVIAGWLAALATLWWTLYGLWFSSERTDVPQATAVIYLTFCRLAWGIAVCWIIFACLQDYGGPIGVILSWNFWIPLARLTYCAYLIHPVIIFSKVYSDAVLFHMSYVTLSYFFVGNLVFSYAAALVLSLLVEGPTMGLEKVMFGKFKKS